MSGALDRTTVAKVASPRRVTRARPSDDRRDDESSARAMHDPAVVIPTYPADSAILVETRLERRDGDTWLSGICSFCWERQDFRASEGNTLHCRNGHLIHVVEQQCVGACALSGPLEHHA